jgi:hypothetical protein
MSESVNVPLLEPKSVPISLSGCWPFALLLVWLNRWVGIGKTWRQNVATYYRSRRRSDEPWHRWGRRQPEQGVRDSALRHSGYIYSRSRSIFLFETISTRFGDSGANISFSSSTCMSCPFVTVMGALPLPMLVVLLAWSWCVNSSFEIVRGALWLQIFWQENKVIAFSG